MDHAARWPLVDLDKNPRQAFSSRSHKMKWRSLSFCIALLACVQPVHADWLDSVFSWPSTGWRHTAVEVMPTVSASHPVVDGGIIVESGCGCHYVPNCRMEPVCHSHWRPFDGTLLAHGSAWLHCLKPRWPAHDHGPVCGNPVCGAAHSCQIVSPCRWTPTSLRMELPSLPTGCQCGTGWLDWWPIHVHWHRGPLCPCHANYETWKEPIEMVPVNPPQPLPDTTDEPMDTNA